MPSPSGVCRIQWQAPAPMRRGQTAAATVLAGLALARFTRPVARAPGVYTH